MDRDRLILGVASVLAGTAVLMAIFGITTNPVFALVALPFGAAAYFLWEDATGRLAERMRARARRRRGRRTRGRAADGGRARAGRGARERTRTRERVRPPEPREPSAAEARRVLGVGADDGKEAVRRAYRERVKEVHPDREGGDEEAFKRVQDAYDRLSER